ncbi:MAG: tRNA-dihydrouridine synthase family protein [Coriobacteriaceae bacterium]|nr:tRNA-dihydrouridine synthase family protein [Coriobacteriaceae bacterium]
MIYSLAPMEGITGHSFRRAHAACFGALDRYYTPFLPPPRVGNKFGGKHFKEIDPKNNQGLNVVPQLLTKNADEFVWAARLLADMGYREVNLNLGCPSGTVVSKGKGSGFLCNLDKLEVFLRDVCDRSPIPVSVKTRLGLESDSEYERILDLYCQLPLAELIVHPRVQKDRYEGHPRWEPYGETLARAPFAVAYNGDIFAPENLEALAAAHPATRHVMLGRGLLANPALARMLRGGSAATALDLRQFHDQLYGAYLDEIGGNAVFRMKEWWFYAKFAFANPMTVHRAVRKVRKTEDYEAAVERIFAAEPLAPRARYRG